MAAALVDLQVVAHPLDARQTIDSLRARRLQKKLQHQHEQQPQRPAQALTVPSASPAAAEPAYDRVHKTRHSLTAAAAAARIPATLNPSKFKRSSTARAAAVPSNINSEVCSKQVDIRPCAPQPNVLRTDQSSVVDHAHAKIVSPTSTWRRRTTVTGLEHPSSDQQQPSPQVCRFWLNGCCSRGPRCKFLHSHHPTTPSTTTNSRHSAGTTGQHHHPGPSSESCTAAAGLCPPASRTTHRHGLTAGSLVEDEPLSRNRGNDDDDDHHPINTAEAEAAEIRAHNDDQSNRGLDTAAAPDDHHSPDHLLQGHIIHHQQQLHSLACPVASLQHEQQQPLRGIALPGPGFNCLYTASGDGTLHIWDSATGAHIGAGLPRLQSTARSSSSSMNAAQSHSSSGAGLVLLRPFFMCEWIFLGVPGEVQAWHLSTSTSTAGHVCTQLDVDRKVTLSVGRDPAAACDDDQHRDAIHSLCVMPQGLVLAGTQDGTILVWRFDPSAAASSAQPLLPCARLTGHTASVSALESTAADLYIVFSASADGVIRVWDMSNEAGGQYRCLCTLRGHIGPVTGLLSLDRDHLFSSSLDGTIKLWKWSSSTPPPIQCTTTPHLLGDDAQHMNGQDDHQLLMLQLQHTICPSPHVVDPSKSPPPAASAASAGHEVLALAGFIDVDDMHVLVCACGGADNTVRLFELPSLKERAVLPARSPVTALEVGPGGLLFLLISSRSHPHVLCSSRTWTWTPFSWAFCSSSPLP